MKNMFRKRFALNSLKTALTLAFVFLAGLYVWLRRDEFLALHWPSVYAILIVAIAYVINVYLTSVYNLITARRLGAGLTSGESFMLSAVVAAGNFLLPVKAGAGVRALYMKKVHDFPVSYFTGAALIFVLVSLLVMSLVAMLLIYLIYLQQGYFRLDLSILFPLTSLGLVAVLVILRNGVKQHESAPASWFASLRSSLHMIAGEKKLIFSALVLVSMIFLVASIVWTVALREFAPEISIGEALLLTASQIISGFVTLTPGAAGFQEMAALYVGQSFTATTTEIFAVLIWVRVVRVVTAIGVAIPSVWFLRGKFGGLSGKVTMLGDEP